MKKSIITNLPPSTGMLHTYNQEIADEISGKVIDTYFPLFQEFASKVQDLIDGK